MRRMFFGNKRMKKEPMDIDITSLLDILVILLVFLLKSYNASNLKLDLVKGLKIPDSQTRKLGAHSVILQVDKESNIWFKSKKIAKISTSPQTIKELLTVLNKEQDQYKEKSKEKKKNKAINLVFDKKLSYKNMKKVMHTSAIAGFTEFKFIVQGNY